MIHDTLIAANAVLARPGWREHDDGRTEAHEPQVSRGRRPHGGRAAGNRGSARPGRCRGKSRWPPRTVGAQDRCGHVRPSSRRVEHDETVIGLRGVRYRRSREVLALFGRQLCARSLSKRLPAGGSMRMSRQRGTPRRPSRWASVIGAIGVGWPRSRACSSGPPGIVVNLYGGASGAGFDKIIADCNQQAAGRYTIVGNLLPSDADGQRDQFVRRLAAQDDGMDLLGMDVTWTAEFAEAGWIRELTGEQKAAGDQGHPRSRRSTRRPGRTSSTASRAPPTCSCSGTASRWCPTPPKTCDEMIAMAQQLKAEGKPYEIGFTAAQYEGYVVNINNLITALRRHARQRGQHHGDRRRQDRAGADHAPEARHLRADQQVAVEHPGARGLRRPAGRAVGVLPELALRAQRHARGQPGPGRHDLGFARTRRSTGETPRR